MYVFIICLMNVGHQAVIVDETSKSHVRNLRKYLSVNVVRNQNSKYSLMLKFGIYILGYKKHLSTKFKEFVFQLGFPFRSQKLHKSVRSKDI
jgi:hypothetical protein